MIGPFASLSVAVPIRSIRMSKSEINGVLDELDKATEQSGDKGFHRRRHERHRCRQYAVLVRVKQTGQQPTNFLVPTRNVSNGGVSFLHGAMLHPNTRCTIVFLLPDRRTFRTQGRVVRSRHVTGMIYEIGIGFDAPISVKDLQLGDELPEAPQVPDADDCIKNGPRRLPSARPYCSTLSSNPLGEALQEHHRPSPEDGGLGGPPPSGCFLKRSIICTAPPHCDTSHAAEGPRESNPVPAFS